MNRAARKYLLEAEACITIGPRLDRTECSDGMENEWLEKSIYFDVSDIRVVTELILSPAPGIAETAGQTRHS